MSDDLDYKSPPLKIVKDLACLPREELAALRAEIERLRAALKNADEAINPPDRGGISLDIWQRRLKAATAEIRAALSDVDQQSGAQK